MRKKEETTKAIKMKYLSEIVTKEYRWFFEVYHWFLESGIRMLVSPAQKRITQAVQWITTSKNTYMELEYSLQPYQWWSLLLKELGQLSLLQSQLPHSWAWGSVKCCQVGLQECQREAQDSHSLTGEQLSE